MEIEELSWDLLSSPLVQKEKGERTGVLWGERRGEISSPTIYFLKLVKDIWRSRFPSLILSVKPDCEFVMPQ